MKNMLREIHEETATLTPEAVRAMVQSGQWMLEIPVETPDDISVPKQRRFKYRMEMVKAYVLSDKSVRDLGKEARQRGWARHNLTRQATHLHLGTAIRWLVEHKCLVNTARVRSSGLDGEAPAIQMAPEIATLHTINRASKKLRKVTAENIDYLVAAANRLRESKARQLIKNAGAQRTLAKYDSLLKSLDGAIRHARNCAEQSVTD